MPYMKLEFSGLEQMMARYKKLGISAKPATEKALLETHRYVTDKLHAAMAKPNLPAHGKYDTGKTEEAIIDNAQVLWGGTVATIKCGFDFSKPKGVVSAFLMYGTPRMSPDRMLKPALKGSAMKRDVGKIQEKIFYEMLREAGK